MKRKPEPTLAAWNTNLRVVSNKVNQNPALSRTIILQFLILLPVLRSFFAACVMGVRLQGEIHLPWAPELQGWKAAPAVEQLCRSFSEVQQKGLWHEVVSFIFFYYFILFYFVSPAVGVSGLSTVTAVVPRSIREGGKTQPHQGQDGWILNKDFILILFFLTMGCLNFLLPCC